MDFKARALALPRAVFSRFADNSNPASVASKMRRRRLSLLIDVFDTVETRPIRVLDVGGAPGYWHDVGRHCDHELRVTLLNIEAFEPVDDPRIETVVGDARDLSEYPDDAFEVVFSNSVIEHVGDFDDQRAMAAECRRVGRHVVVQTPNHWFPIEPHFVFPFFQFLPIRVRAELHRRFTLGWMPAAGDLDEAMAEVRQIRLLTRGQMRELFPDCEVLTERFLGLPKSFIARR